MTSTPTSERTTRLPKPAIVRGAIAWCRIAKAAGEPAIADAALELARVALDSYLADVRRGRLCPLCEHEHEPGTHCCTLCGYKSWRPNSARRGAAVPK